MLNEGFIICKLYKSLYSDDVGWNFLFKEDYVNGEIKIGKQSLMPWPLEPAVCILRKIKCLRCYINGCYGLS